MSLGIVLIIKADLGASPWDVFHIGLYKQLGLTIGTWSIIAGFVILLVSFLLTKRLPQIGAFLNMIFVGVFIDMYMMIPWFITPPSLTGQIFMLLLGVIINGYGMGIYIASNVGAGPRDSLMLALTEISKWKVQYIRSGIEIIVLTIGWLLGGPVFLGTILYSVAIGYVVGFTLPQCKHLFEVMNRRIQKTQEIEFNHFSS